MTDRELMQMALNAMKAGLAEIDAAGEVYFAEDKKVDQKLHEAIVFISHRLSQPDHKTKWKCPINNPNCKQNCGSYGCGN